MEQQHQGNRIKGILRSKGITNRQVASELNISEEHVSRTLKGKKVPDLFIKRLTEMYPDLQQLFDEFKSPDHTPKERTEVDFLRQQNQMLEDNLSDLRQQIQESNAAIRRLLTIIETTTVK